MDAAIGWRGAICRSDPMGGRMDPAVEKVILALATVATGLIGVIAWLVKQTKGQDKEDPIVRKLDEVLKELRELRLIMTRIDERTDHQGR